jgi:hypothetical protein
MKVLYCIRKVMNHRFCLNRITVDDSGRSHGEPRFSGSLGYLRGLIPNEFRKTNGDASEGTPEIYEVKGSGKQEVSQAVPSSAHRERVH